MWLKCLKWLCLKTIKTQLNSTFRIYIKKLLILDKTSSNIIMRFIIYTVDKLSINKFENDTFKNDELENDDESLFDEIVDNKCNDKIIIHVFSQLKKNTLLTRFFVMFYDSRRKTFLICTSSNKNCSIDQNWLKLENISKRKTRSKKNIGSLNVNFACHFYRVLLDDYHRFVEIIHTNEFREERVRDKNRSILYFVLRANRV